MRAPDSKWLRGITAGCLVLMIGFVAGRASAGGAIAAPNAGGTSVENATTQAADPPPRRGSASARRTLDGAVTAAAEHAVALDGPALLDPERRRPLIEEIAARHAQSDLEDRLGRVASLLVNRLGLTADVVEDGSFVWRAVPAGWRVVSHDGSRAEVAIWTTGLAMAHGRLLAPQAWRTTFVDLIWERGRWRLVGFRSEAGPEPPSFGGGTAGRLVAQEIGRFESFTFQPRSEHTP